MLRNFEFGTGKGSIAALIIVSVLFAPHVTATDRQEARTRDVDARLARRETRKATCILKECSRTCPVHLDYEKRNYSGTHKMEAKAILQKLKNLLDLTAQSICAKQVTFTKAIELVQAFD